MVEGNCGHSRFTNTCPVCAPNSGLRGCSHGKGHLGAHRRAPSRPVRVGVLGHAPCAFCSPLGSGSLHCLFLEPIVWLSPQGSQGTNEGHSAWCQGEGTARHRSAGSFLRFGAGAATAGEGRGGLPLRLPLLRAQILIVRVLGAVEAVTEAQPIPVCESVSGASGRQLGTALCPLLRDLAPFTRFTISPLLTSGPAWCQPWSPCLHPAGQLAGRRKREAQGVPACQALFLHLTEQNSAAWPYSGVQGRGGDWRALLAVS